MSNLIKIKQCEPNFWKIFDGGKIKRAKQLSVGKMEKCQNIDKIAIKILKFVSGKKWKNNQKQVEQKHLNKNVANQKEKCKTRHFLFFPAAIVFK